MTKTAGLRLEQLEDRCTPATFGVPWLDGAHLTLSFAPDGTAIGTGSSSLFSTLDSQIGNPSLWEHEILRAFQTWAVNANVNFAVVGDGGQPFGITGAIQGDPRFGDIRIGETPLSTNSVATSLPFNLTAGTWSGDVVLNSNYTFGIGAANTYDLFSVLLHEAGHALGVDDNPDTASPMFRNYLGIRVNLTSADIATIQSIYGARQADAFDAASPNNSFATATVVQPFSVSQVRNVSLNADVTTHQDVDFYRFRTSSYCGGISFRLQTSGLSLLTSRLSVYDSSQRLVNSVVATDPMSGDLVIHLDRVQADSVYYIKVQGASSDVFSIGSYRLQIQPDQTNAPDDNGGSSSADDNSDGSDGSRGNNHSFDMALRLHTYASATDQRFTFYTQGTLATPDQADYYRFRTPGQPSDPPIPAMNLLLWAAPGSRLAPLVSVFDAQRHPVAAEILVNENGSYTVQVANVTPHARYFVVVQSADPTRASNVGDYSLAVTFAGACVRQDAFISATLTDSNPQDFRSLQVNKSQVFHFVVSGSTGGAAVPTAMRMTIYDESGNVYFTLVVHDGETRSATLFLQKGNYTFRFAARTRTGAPLPNWNYSLIGASLSDPIGPLPSDPSGDPNGGSREPPFVWGTGTPTGDSGGSDPWW